MPVRKDIRAIMCMRKYERVFVTYSPARIADNSNNTYDAYTTLYNRILYSPCHPVNTMYLFYRFVFPFEHNYCFIAVNLFKMLGAYKQYYADHKLFILFLFFYCPILHMVSMCSKVLACGLFFNIFFLLSKTFDVYSCVVVTLARTLSTLNRTYSNMTGII